MLAFKKSFREKVVKIKLKKNKKKKKSTPLNLQRISGMDDNKLVRACCCSQLKNDDDKF